MAAMAVAFDPTRPSYLENPYPALTRLRERQPVYWWDAFDSWLVTSHELCTEVLNDVERFRTDPVHVQGPDHVRDEELRRRTDLLGGANRLVSTDPPDHDRRRDIVARAFAHRSLDELRPAIEAEVDELLDAVADGETVDAVVAIARPLPLAAIARQLGVSDADRATVIGGSQRILAAVNPLAPEAKVNTGRRAVADLDGYLSRVAAGEVDVVGGEVLAQMVEAETAGELTRAELLALTVDLATAGNQALEMAIGNSLYHLLRNPDQLDLVRADPAKIRHGIDELLRYETPTQAMPWFVASDTRLGDRDLVAGQKLFVMAGAANRDPEVFDRPDELDIERSARRHLAFGAGIHRCLGAALATRELEIVLTALLDRFADIRLRTRTISWDSGFMHRGVKKLPIACRTR